MKNQTHFFLGLLALSLSATFAHGESSEPITLNPIVSEGTAAESLKFDPIVPAYTGKTKGNLSTGDVSKDLANDLPFHSNSSLKPGNETSFNGIGKGAEETDVNLLGIPINRPQGGGVDLGSFPQYFWSGYNYQIGPSMGAFDPRGVGGSLTLRLWTQDHLGTDTNRATALYSSLDVQQFSIGRSSKNYAILAGVTTDSVFGPALAFAGIPVETGDLKITTHLIYSDVNAKNFVSERYGSSTAEQHTYRLLPVVQVDRRFSETKKLKTSFFYDLSYVRYVDNADASAKQIKKIHQAGNESAFITGDTRIGFGLRHVSYERASLSAVGTFPSEQVLNTQLSHGLHFGDLLVEPTFGGYAVTRKGFFPTGSIGIRNEKNSDEATYGQFLRIGFTKRFPSLLDRYYEINQQVSPSFTIRGLSNPALGPENVRSVEAGADYRRGTYKNQITLFARDYQHARYTRTFMISTSPLVQGYQIVNAGKAYVYGATGSQDWKAHPMVDLGTRLTFQHSKIEDLHTRFPYSPDWVAIVKADLHDPDNRYGLEIVNKGATSYLAYQETSGNPSTLGSYYYLDLFARTEVLPAVTLVAGVENVFNRDIAFRAGAPSEGRIYSLSANAVF